MLSCEFCKIFKNKFLYRTPPKAVPSFPEITRKLLGNYSCWYAFKTEVKINFSECLEASIMLRKSFQNWFGYANNGISVIKCPTLIVDFKEKPKKLLIKASLLLNIKKHVAFTFLNLRFMASLEKNWGLPSLFHICDVLRNLVPFVQFKKREKQLCNTTPSWMFFTFLKLYK